MGEGRCLDEGPDCLPEDYDGESIVFLTGDECNRVQICHVETSVAACVGGRVDAPGGKRLLNDCGLTSGGNGIHRPGLRVDCEGF